MESLRKALGVTAAVIGCFSLLLAAAAPALADDSEDRPEFSMDIDPVMFVQLDRENLDFNPGVNELIAGQSAAQQLTARVTANTDWVLTIAGSAELWDGPWAKPVGDILWRCGSGEFSSLTLSGVEIGSGGPAREQAVGIDFRIRLDVTKDTPGSYRYEYIVFQVAAQ